MKQIHPKIHTKIKLMLESFLTIFKVNDNVFTLENTASQSWLNYIGLKRENYKFRGVPLKDRQL